VYSDPKGRTYISTAGHCVLGAPAVGEAPYSVSRVWPSGRGPIATDINDKPIGRFVYAAERGDLDIALIQVSSGIRVNPQMCHFGGPTGTSTTTTSAPTQLDIYGNAVGIGELLPARTGVAMGMRERNWVYALAPSFLGDSGGPVINDADGKVIGFVDAIGYAVSIGTEPLVGTVFIARMGPQIAAASKALRTTFTLRTAKRL
jgi:hypothetical protein